MYIFSEKTFNVCVFSLIYIYRIVVVTFGGAVTEFSVDVLYIMAYIMVESITS